MTNEMQLARLLEWRHEFATRQEKTNADVEQRLRRLEKALYCCTGGLAVLQLILKFIHP